MFAGPLAGRYGYRQVLVAGMAVQGVSTLPLIFVRSERIGLAILGGTSANTGIVRGPT